MVRLLALGVFLGFCLVLAPSAGRACVPDFMDKWGVPGSGNGDFDNPSGLAVDPDGNIYVADRNNHRIQKFDSSGNFLLGWGQEGSSAGDFQSPWDVAVDSNFNVYVADTENSRVQKFNSSGGFLGQWDGSGTPEGLFFSVYGVAVDDNGNVYVTDEGVLTTIRIRKFSNTGSPLGSWGSRGAGGSGTFQSARDIEVDGNCNVYVVDSVNSRIQKFDCDGNFLGQWGAQGTGNGQFTFPRGLDTSRADTVCVTDDTNRVQCFDSAGNFLCSWGSTCIIADGTGCTDPDGGGPQEPGDGQFHFSHDVVVRGSSLYVSDRLNHRIQKFEDAVQVGVPGDDPVRGGVLRAHPNPMRRGTRVLLPLAETVSGGGRYRVQAQVFDLTGRLVRNLYTGTLPPGEHELVWDGATVDGNRAGPGIYFVRVVVAGWRTLTTRVVRLP